ncbi:DUF1707 SHOCT-like domain-containing protein [Nocardioides zhouii]|uniref:DUF1707 domain-containing protein n=1 Tax=Nocardioides zhouii TaxID=1168729 RepID=A0A4Q2T5V4_9ACTN|nr:DUF1707 domain-containing protein [Nocardioides zhouii]RYC14206.1 DUF1707 domain-containing protein [Nocardioides zhouii]
MSQQPDETAPLDEFVQRHIADATRRRREREDAEATLRSSTLASDTDRDLTANVLNDAFAQGRLTSEEHAERTTRAFTARTHGDLDQVLTGLQVTAAPARVPGARKVVFWGVTVMTSPFLMMGLGLFLAGSGLGSHIVGFFLLMLFAPGLFALHRWAFPKTAAARWPSTR